MIQTCLMLALSFFFYTRTRIGETFMIETYQVIGFQIRDDILDVIGSQQELGKAVGVDGAKNTFVRLYGVEKCEELVKQYTQEAIDSLSVFRDTEYMEALAESLTERRK